MGKGVGMIKYMTDPVAVQENYGVVIKAWVYENDTWTFRELTKEEIAGHAQFGVTVESSPTLPE